MGNSRRKERHNMRRHNMVEVAENATMMTMKVEGVEGRDTAMMPAPRRHGTDIYPDAPL